MPLPGHRREEALCRRPLLAGLIRGLGLGHLTRGHRRVITLDASAVTALGACSMLAMTVTPMGKFKGLEKAGEIVTDVAKGTRLGRIGKAADVVLKDGKT